MLAIVASGVSVGCCGAAVVWSEGHHPMMIMAAYALTGMIGMVGSASWLAGSHQPGSDPSL